jgi:hypothetical protein
MIQLFSVFPMLASAFGHISDAVEDAMVDGDMSADDAAGIGEAVAVELGNLQLVINGRDVLHKKAQIDLCRGVARVLFQITKALKED